MREKKKSSKAGTFIFLWLLCILFSDLAASFAPRKLMIAGSMDGSSNRDSDITLHKK